MDNEKNAAEPSGASGGSRAQLTSRLAKAIGADPTLTQSIRIDVNFRNEPTVTVTRLADADQIGRIIQSSTFADYTLVENEELKRLRKGATLTDAEREAVWAVAEAYAENDDDPECHQIARVMYGLWQKTR